MQLPIKVGCGHLRQNEDLRKRQGKQKSKPIGATFFATTYMLACTHTHIPTHTLATHTLRPHTGAAVVPASIRDSTLLDLQPLVDLLHTTSPPRSCSIPPKTMATCRVLGMLRQAAWLLVHVGVRAAHLYLYSCSQQHDARVTGMRNAMLLTKDAYRQVEMGKQCDHEKLAILKDLLRHWARSTQQRHLEVPPTLLTVLLVAHPLVHHALKRTVEDCGYTVEDAVQVPKDSCNTSSKHINASNNTSKHTNVYKNTNTEAPMTGRPPHQDPATPPAVDVAAALRTRVSGAEHSTRPLCVLLPSGCWSTSCCTGDALQGTCECVVYWVG